MSDVSLGMTRVELTNYRRESDPCLMCSKQKASLVDNGQDTNKLRVFDYDTEHYVLKSSLDSSKVGFVSSYVLDYDLAVVHSLLSSTEVAYLKLSGRELRKCLECKQ